MLEYASAAPSYSIVMKTPFVTLLSFLLGIALFGAGAKPAFTQQGDALPLDNTAAPVNCSAVHAGASCASFNEMLKAGKFESVLDNKRVKTWVCFRQQQDSFMMLHFYLPRYWATDKGETARVQKAMADKPHDNPNNHYLMGEVTSAPFVFREFTNKDQSATFKATLEWKKSSDQDDSAATGLSKSPDISVTPAAISVSAAKTDKAGASLSYSIMIDSVMKTFSEFMQYVGKPATEETGFCAEF